MGHINFNYGMKTDHKGITDVQAWMIPSSRPLPLK